MKKLSNIEEKIISQLKVSEGATTKNIARNLNIGIGTASKYLDVLKAQGKITLKIIGPSNYWNITAFPDFLLNFEKFKEKLKLNKNGELTFDDMCLVIFPFPYYISLMENMIKTIGYGKVRKIAYSTAKKWGIEFYDNIKGHTSLEGIPLLKNILDFISILGYGRFELKSCDLSSGESIIVCPPHEFKKTKNILCLLISGKIAGIVSKLSGLDVECEETKCITRGDPHCEFITKLLFHKKIDKKMYMFARKMNMRKKSKDYRLR